jgi:hypothetical protein
LEVDVSPTRRIKILGLDNRSFSNIVWCAATYGISRLYWIGGYVMCLEVYEKAFEHELKMQEFPVSQICFAEFPKYMKVFELDKSLQIPLIDVSDMKLFQKILAAILEYQKRPEPREKAE